jgi:hypothetical protein
MRELASTLLSWRKEIGHSDRTGPKYRYTSMTLFCSKYFFACNVGFHLFHFFSPVLVDSDFA